MTLTSIIKTLVTLKPFRVTLIAVALFLSACGSQPQKKDPTDSSYNPDLRQSTDTNYQQPSKTSSASAQKDNQVDKTSDASINKDATAAKEKLKRPFQEPSTAPREGPYESLTPEEYKKLVGNISQWQVQGKLGIRVPDNSGSLYYNWKQGDEQFAIHLSGPMGRGASWIRGDDHFVSIQAGDQPTVYAPSSSSLMEKTLGWSLPIDEMYYWARGVISPHSPVDNYSLDSLFRMQELEQSGWTIRYKRYAEFNGWRLPKKIVIERQDIRLTLVMKNWIIY